MILYTVILSLAVPYLTTGTDYFVSLEGNDNNPGTISSPFQHVQKAVEVLKPGDVCTLRGGRYSEEVSISGLQGSPGYPITFRAYPGEEVVFDGTAPLVSEWKQYKDNIYMTKVSSDIWQLFVDGEMQVNARWPNAFWSDFSVFDYTHWGFSSALSTYDQESGEGIMVDNGTQNLAKSGLNATDAMAILNIGSWMTYAGYVRNHIPGENNFRYDLSVVVGGVHFVSRNCRYFLEDKLDFLDAPTEWFYDQTNGYLYLWTSTGDSPEKHNIATKVSTYAISVTNTSSWLVFSDLHFFGTTVYMRGSSGIKDIHNIVLDSLDFTYPSYSKRMLKSVALPNTTTLFYNGLLTEKAGNFTIFNCTWRYADGQTMTYRGADGHIENNLWHHNDFTCVGNGRLFHSEGVRDNFFRNVIHSNGPSIGFEPGIGNSNDRTLGLSTGSTVKLNLLYDLKYLQDDGSLIQTEIPAQSGVFLEYNWGYDTLKYGLRFDCGVCTEATWGHNGTMRYNVIWNTRGMSVKGNNHSVMNNLVFNSSIASDLFLQTFTEVGKKGENNLTVSTGNILEQGPCSGSFPGTCKFPIPGNFTNNYVGDIFKNLRDPNNLDFRPKATSDLVSKEIGPYGKESMNHGGTYWIPGRLLPQTSSPIPPNATATAKCDADLMWLTGYGADKHNVYFGTDQSSVRAATGPSSATFLGQLTSPSNIVSPGPLKSQTLYFWRVDAVDGDIVVTGSIWSFQCSDL